MKYVSSWFSTGNSAVAFFSMGNFQPKARHYTAALPFNSRLWCSIYAQCIVSNHKFDQSWIVCLWPLLHHSWLHMNELLVIYYTFTFLSYRCRAWFLACMLFIARAMKAGGILNCVYRAYHGVFNTFVQFASDKRSIPTAHNPLRIHTEDNYADFYRIL